MEKNKPLVIGVAGGSGSGKTTIINSIIEEINPLDVVTLQHDSYYRDNNHLPLLERENINYDHPEALETDLLISNLRALLEWKEVEAPIYDFKTHSRKKRGVIKKPAEVVIVDGILIFVEEKLRDLMDVRIFVNTDSDMRFIRRLKRDMVERNRSMDSVINQYLATVKPMHLAFVQPSRRFADIIIPEGMSPISTSMVVNLIENHLKKGDVKS
ncbi:MAG: uridine kinase [Candidatus Heimdallarchaeota archaeon]|nr:uridine kinase [Candidatus Heimdallarchaeota archaeon]